MGTLKVCKDVTLLGEDGNMAVLKFHKDVTFLGKKGTYL